jgi:hypothetical protein
MQKARKNRILAKKQAHNEIIQNTLENSKIHDVNNLCKQNAKELTEKPYVLFETVLKKYFFNGGSNSVEKSNTRKRLNKG